MNVEIIKQMVYKAFMRLMKEKGFINFYKKAQRTLDCPKNVSIEDFIFKHSMKEWEHNKRDGSEYEMITFYINNLIKSLLEAQGYKSQNLQEFGQTVFDMSCNRMYGKKYLEDIKKLESENPRARGNDFVNFVQMMHKQSKSSLSLGEFFNAYKNDLEMLFQKRYIEKEEEVF